MTTDEAPETDSSGDTPEEEEQEYYIHPVHGVKVFPIKGVTVPTEEELKRFVVIGTHTSRS